MYRRNANSLSVEITKVFPDAQITLNPSKPRSKSFEVSLVKEGGGILLFFVIPFSVTDTAEKNIKLLLEINI